MIADAHNDLLLELAHREHRLGETNVFAQTWLPLLEAGGVGLQVCPIFVDLDRQPEGTLRDALGQAASFHRAVRENADRVVAVRTRSDLDLVESGERIGLMLALEGVEPFGYELWGADVFWELGLRMAGLTWNRRNPFADGAADEGGLSRLGRSLLPVLAEREIVLDLAHASPKLFDECLAAYEGPGLHHARGLLQHQRPSAQRHRRATARTGCPRRDLRGDVAPDRDRPERRTIERAIDHLEHAVELVGPDRVCLGSDWTKRLHALMPKPVPPDGLLPPGLDVGATIEGLPARRSFPALVEALQARGWRTSS